MTLQIKTLHKKAWLVTAYKNIVQVDCHVSVVFELYISPKTKKVSKVKSNIKCFFFNQNLFFPFVFHLSCHNPDSSCKTFGGGLTRKLGTTA